MFFLTIAALITTIVAVLVPYDLEPLVDSKVDEFVAVSDVPHEEKAADKAGRHGVEILQKVNMQEKERREGNLTGILGCERNAWVRTRKSRPIWLYRSNEEGDQKKI